MSPACLICAWIASIIACPSHDLVQRLGGHGLRRVPLRPSAPRTSTCASRRRPAPPTPAIEGPGAPDRASPSARRRRRAVRASAARQLLPTRSAASAASRRTAEGARQVLGGPCPARPWRCFQVLTEQPHPLAQAHRSVCAPRFSRDSIVPVTARIRRSAGLEPTPTPVAIVAATRLRLGRPAANRSVNRVSRRVHPLPARLSPARFVELCDRRLHLPDPLVQLLD